jgi:UDP-glucuronate 4-epimerase
VRCCLVTGGAGFIGSHVVESLLSRNWRVIAVDNFDPFYARASKERNLLSARGHRNFSLVEVDIRDKRELFRRCTGPFDTIIHLAARPGVQPSVIDPTLTYSVNVMGTAVLLELAQQWVVPQFIFASSSSVYGINPTLPWREEGSELRPISPYASTKICGEMLGHVYSHLSGNQFLALRLFTVYGPRQRPDLAIHKFTRLMMDHKPLPLFGSVQSSRDYTFVDDVVQGILAAVEYTGSKFEIINIGNDRAVSLPELVHGLEATTGLAADIQWHPPLPGDAPLTRADIRKAKLLLGYRPQMPMLEGLQHFWNWVKLNAPTTQVDGQEKSIQNVTAKL